MFFSLLGGLFGPFKGVNKFKKENNRLKNKCSKLVFPNIWPLDAGIGYFWPQIRILREISSLEPAGNVQNPKSRSENDEINFLICFF